MSEESTEKQQKLQLSERDLHPRPPDFISSALDFGHAAPTIWCYRLTHCIFIDGAWLELARILSNRIQAGIVVHRAWFLINFAGAQFHELNWYLQFNWLKTNDVKQAMYILSVFTVHQQKHLCFWYQVSDLLIAMMPSWLQKIHLQCFYTNLPNRCHGDECPPYPF